jgi:hypothetical protein
MPRGILPIVLFGQDEAIFKQFLSWWKAWSGPGGVKALWPKDDGLAVMISAIVSRELGWGVEWTDALIEMVNQYRRDKKYQDEEAAIKINGKAEKSDLTSSPFVIEFEYGASSKGYWRYEHMVLQIEDCNDVLKVLMDKVWKQQYEIHFMLDHSQNHNKHTPDGLNAKAMNSGYGGAQPKMHDTKLEHENCVGAHPNENLIFYEALATRFPTENEDENPFDEYGSSVAKISLQQGGIQSMSYDASNHPGPFNMTTEERERRKYDRRTGIFFMRKKRMTELKAELKEKGVNAKGKMKRVIELATTAGVALEVREEKVEQGWHGQAKGLLQILFERGLIDPAKFDPRDGKRQKYYSVDGKKDKFGNAIHDSTCLRRLAEQLPDFVNEETLLQFNCKQFGVIVDHSPIAHPECAGEGVEYDWGFSKIIYQRHPLDQKKKKDNFRKLVSKCISRETITINHRRKFARRARQYIVAYRAFAEHTAQIDADGSQSTEDVAMSAALIEKVVKVYKSHRNIVDQEKGYIKKIVDLMKNFSYK